jgi:hypothetical protein
VTEQFREKSQASGRSCVMARMGYLWGYFAYPHPSRIEGALGWLVRLKLRVSAANLTDP